MIIVPEIQKVFILVPRTGTGSLYREIMRVYPRSFLLYRHMEADGVPHGYDRWERVGFVRHPVARLWSLYNYLGTYSSIKSVAHDEAFSKRMRESVNRPFEDWLLNNEIAFSHPHDMVNGAYHYPALSRRHPLPDNRLSQFVYLRPDLGTTVHHYENLPHIMAELGLDSSARSNNSSKISGPPPLSIRGLDHITKFFKWDIAQKCAFV